jgi:hypothetical protein
MPNMNSQKANSKEHHKEDIRAKVRPRRTVGVRVRVRVKIRVKIGLGLGLRLRLGLSQG